jgi:hypothetical protein
LAPSPDGKFMLIGARDGSTWRWSIRAWGASWPRSLGRPLNGEAKWRLCTSHMNLGRLSVRKDNLPEARRHYHRMVEVAEWWFRDEPSNMDARLTVGQGIKSHPSCD